jgi:hypothetical protein
MTVDLKNRLIWKWELFFFTLSSISAGVSVRKIEELASDALIFDWAPCSAGKKIEWSKAHFGKLRRDATSRVIRKNGSYHHHKIKWKENKFDLTWSIAHGIRHLNSSLSLPLNINGNEELIAGAAWIAGKPIFPIASLSLRPNIAKQRYNKFDSKWIL